MFDWLKRHFIPHVGNDHQPHFLRGDTVRRVIGVVLVVELILFALPTLNFVTIIKHSNIGAVLPAVLAAGTNQERQYNELPELVSNALLNQAAQLKAEDMAAKSYFAHTSPDGKTPWYWLTLVGYGYEYAGENLAVNFTDSQDVTEAWMNSPTHRSNITKQNYTEMGTGVAFGTYKGQDSVFVVQLYANPKVSPQKSSPRLAVEEALGTRVAEAEQGVSEALSEPILAQVEDEQPTQVLGESTEEPVIAPIATLSAQNPSFLEKIIASPRHTTNLVFYTVIGLIIFALSINVLVKFEHQHPHLVTNGLFAIVFIFGVYLANTYIAKAAGFQTTYTDTSLERPQ